MASEGEKYVLNENSKGDVLGCNESYTRTSSKIHQMSSSSNVKFEDISDVIARCNS